MTDDPLYPNPLRAAEARANREKDRADFFQFLTAWLCVLVVALGMFAGHFAAEHDEAVKQRVQQTIALPRQ